jgi:predicted RNA-binding Zn ribbon-like protein
MTAPSPTQQIVDDETQGSGGRLCLDFTNTASGRQTPAPTEHLHTYGDLVAWALDARIIDAAAAAALEARAAAEPGQAAAVLARAVCLRDAIYRIFSADAAGQPPAPDDLALLNAELARALGHAKIAGTGDQFAWVWEQNGELELMLWPVARSAADLLTSSERDRVRECAGDTCNWLFLDRSKNHSRRWCDMQECGNVAKVRRYRRRKQESD